ncbi:hypothetical protein [Staphylococcus kloosii]|uniref:hypothetical protein n=1 Tax=Staphylococcus kloosii TaxID=29384 RepID=UPI0028A356BA|nr:hypothetical protein [Staphylococcus kloosii]MDT3959515.1 hypothetical protein [Staphylococcus kloosii]
MKIKRKVEMTQEEYAKYMIDKYGVSGFESRLIDGNIIDAPKRFTLAFEINLVSKSDLLNRSFGNGKFTIEVEEEITEDTEFKKLYYTTILSRIVESSCTTIRSCLKHIAVEPIAFYILNDDLTMTLIWRDGKLIEE